MTARRSRRRRSTWAAALAVVAAVGAAGGLTVFGLEALADSRAGRRAEGQVETRPTQRLPFTATALVGTLDEVGRLTSVVVMGLEPDGTGGTIIELAASADAASGNAPQLEPLHAVLAAAGAEAWALAAEELAGISFDVVELVDQVRFAQLVTPLGDLPVELPAPLYDLSSGAQWPQGAVVLPGLDAARVVTATDPFVEDWRYEPFRAAIWAAVADRVGAGIGTAAPVASDADLPRPPDLDQFVDRLFAGAVEFRQLAVRPLDPERVAEQLPLELSTVFGAGALDAVSYHDRSELLMVMAAVSPGRMGAPLDAPSFRVVSGFTDEQLEPLGLRSSDVLKRAIVRLLFAQVNVVSVADLPGTPVPATSTFLVTEAQTVAGVDEVYAPVFGDEIVVRQSDTLLEGIDIVLVLGNDFLAVVADDLADEAADVGDDGEGEQSADESSDEESA